MTPDPDPAAVLGLAFEGCAGRAAFQAGFAAQLHADGVRPVCVAGASSGSIVAALVAGGHADRLPELWRGAAGQPVFQPRRLIRGRWPWAMSTIVGDALAAVFGDARLADLSLPIAIPVTLLTRGGRRRRLLTRADDLGIVEAVLASCFIPGPYSRVVRVDGRRAWDGAWQLRTPVDAAFGLGAKRVLAVVTDPRRTLLRGFPGEAIEPPAGCTVVGPREPLPVGAWDTDPGRIEAALAAGRRAAQSP